MYNINWRDVQIKNVVNNADISSLRTPWQKGPYKNKHGEQRKNMWTLRRNRHLQKMSVCRTFLSLFLIYLWFLKCIFQELLSCRFGTVNDYPWGVQPVVSYSNYYTFVTFFGNEKEKKSIYSTLKDAISVTFDQNCLQSTF